MTNRIELKKDQNFKPSQGRARFKSSPVVQLARQFNSPSSCLSRAKEQATEMPSPIRDQEQAADSEKQDSLSVWQYPSGPKDHIAQGLKFLTEATELKAHDTTTYIHISIKPKPIIINQINRKIKNKLH